VIDGQVRALRKVVPASGGAVSDAGYVGVYWSEDLGIDYRVELADDHLRLWSRKRGTLRMTARAEDRFSVGNLQITFTRDRAGRVDGFTASTGRVRRVRFERVETSPAKQTPR